MTISTYTPAEFAASFPRARNYDGAISYIAIEHNPKDRDITNQAEAFGLVVELGRTNVSRSKTVTRFAVVSEFVGD